MVKAKTIVCVHLGVNADFVSGRDITLNEDKKTAAWIPLAGNEPFVEDRAPAGRINSSGI